MLSIFKKSKKQSTATSVVEPRLVSTDELEAWLKEVNAGKQYTAHKPFEDPNLVEGADNFTTRMRKELIVSLQNQQKLGYV